MAENEKNIHFPDDPEELNKDRYSVDADKKVTDASSAFPKDPVDLGVDDPERQVDERTVSFPSLTNEDVNKKMEEDEELAQEPLPEKNSFEKTDEISAAEETPERKDEQTQEVKADTTDGKHPAEKHKKISARFLWGISVVCTGLFFIVFASSPLFPFKWKLACLVILVLLLALTGYFSFRKVRKEKKKNGKPKNKKLVIKIINILISVLMAVLSFLLPYYQSKVSHMISTNNITGNKMVKMNLYVMSDAYKNEHASLYTDKKLSTEFKNKEEELQAYKDDTFLTMITVDTTYQKEAIDKLTDLLGKEAKLSDQKSVIDAAEALYNNEAPVMLMSDSYASMLMDTDAYKDFDTETRIIYTIELPEKSKDIALSDADLTEKPFAVFIGGNDEEGTLSLTGRTDVDMVIVVNPKTYQLGIFSFPRDSYIPNPALGNRLDKLTHLGMSGLENTMKGLSNVLDIDIDNYVLLNFTTYRQAINAIGGVDIENPYYFYYSYDHSADFPEGHLHLEDWDALAYVRERKMLPDGDFGRVMHQQIVMKAILQKITSPEMIVHFDSLLDALSGTFLTNLTSKSIYSFMQYQLANSISWNIVNYKLDGGTGMASTASAPGTPLSCVFPYKNKIEFFRKEIDKIQADEIVTQEEIPAGDGVFMWNPVDVPESNETFEEDQYNSSNKINTATSAPVQTQETEEIEENTQIPTALPQETSNAEPTPETTQDADQQEAADSTNEEKNSD